MYFFDITAMLSADFYGILMYAIFNSFYFINKEGRMMKKVILCTVVSLLVFSGFVVGAGTTVAATCADLPNVEACILIKKGGQVQLVPGKDKIIKNPEGGHPKPQKGGKDTALEHLPGGLNGHVNVNPYIQHEITIYGEDTCMRFNGNYYCW